MEGRLSGFPYLILNPISSTEAAKPTMHVFRANERLGTSMEGERAKKNPRRNICTKVAVFKERTEGRRERIYLITSITATKKKREAT